MTKAEAAFTVRHEPMRIAGRMVNADGVVNVHYPYTNAVIGTVPAGRAEHARQAFEIAANYTSKLTRYERQQILFRTADALASRREEISDLITLELGISKADSLYEIGRAYDVFTLSAQMCTWLTATKSSASNNSPTAICCSIAQRRGAPNSPASIRFSCSFSCKSASRLRPQARQAC